MDPFIGEIRMTAWSFAPRGWALCSGQLLPINQNQALFSILGTTYGGDGRINFALPDFRGRLPIHVGTSNALGTKAGAETSTLTVQNMPAHTHTATATPVKSLSTVGTLTNPATAYPSNSNADFSYAATAGATEFAAADSVATVVNPTGSSQPISNMMPSLSVNFMIATTGIFPSRS
jgi:microcystin-dependent protein